MRKTQDQMFNSILKTIKVSHESKAQIAGIKSDLKKIKFDLFLSIRHKVSE